MSLESHEKLKIKIKPVEEAEEKKEEISEEERKVLDILRILRSKKRAISREKLPTWLRDSILPEKKEIEIKKKEYGPELTLILENVRIRIKIRNIRPEKVEIKINKGPKGISFLSLEKELAEEMMKERGIVGMAKDKKGEWIVLKDGKAEEFGFEHIKREHFKGFKRELNIQTEEQLKGLIIKSISEAAKVKYQENKRIYSYPTEKGEVKTVVRLKDRSIITSYL